MHTIAAMNLLLRMQAELPQGFSLATDEFREGWNFSRSIGAGRMGKRLLSQGWSLLRMDGAAQRSGVGNSAQEAIASALTLALRHIAEHFNAVEIEHIELTQYPWFFLARVRIMPYCIQQGAILSCSEHREPPPLKLAQGKLPLRFPILNRHTSITTPILREMLILSRVHHGRPQ